MNKWKLTFLLTHMLGTGQILAEELDDEYDFYTNENILSMNDSENFDDESQLVDTDSIQSATTTSGTSQDFTSQPSSSMTPAVAPIVKNELNVFVTADFIYWKAQQEGLDFAVSGVYENAIQSQPSFIIPVGKGQGKQPDFQFQPGFKLGIGLDFAHDGWDLYANYTWLNPSTHNTTIDKPTDSYLWNSHWNDQLLYAFYASLSSARASWKLNFNVLDLELGRNFFISRFLTLRPFIGLKGALIKQNYDVRYVPERVTNYNFSNFKMKEEVEGIGIRAGINPVWHFVRNWGLYGDLAYSLMWNHISNERSDVFTQIPRITFNGGAPINILNYGKDFHTVMPVLEMGIGLSYMGWFYNETYLLEVKAGWEQQVWFSMNQFLDSYGSPSGNMTTQGLTIKTGFTF